MLSAGIRTACKQALRADIEGIQTVSGGDINEAWLLKTNRGFYFLKTNTVEQAERMFRAEKYGLEALAAANCIRIPEVVDTGVHAGEGYLILEYIPSGRTNSGFWERFGRELAALHQTNTDLFGFPHDNFIGRLEQPNKQHPDWPSFYVAERLRPQEQLASRAGLLGSEDRKRLDQLYQQIESICPSEAPSLVHGDLWSGNFLCSKQGQAVLIDPAVAYAHRELDLAMSRLFGGFDRTFYRAYEEAYPLEPGFERRLPVYQLYYLLVHLNLFGSGYYGSVRRILEKYG